ncbi:MAG: hypothetical protein FJ404_02815 [Verrucomicrobia bacterium]|nr:hypothetical protein [Verrucomicrobiota bacterium]
MPDSPQAERSSEKSFVRWVEYASALCLGGMGGFLVSLRQVNPKLRFEIDALTVLSGLVCFVGTLVAWRWIEKQGGDTQAGKRTRRVAAGLVVLVALALASSFLYSLKDVSAEKRHDFLVGTFCALLVLAVVGYVIRRVGKFLEDPPSE